MQWGIPRLSNLFWSMGQIQEAHDILALLHARVTHLALRLIVEATGAAMAVHENRFDTGLAAAEAVLSNPNSPNRLWNWRLSPPAWRCQSPGAAANTSPSPRAAVPNKNPPTA